MSSSNIATILLHNPETRPSQIQRYARILVYNFLFVFTTRVYISLLLLHLFHLLLYLLLLLMLMFNFRINILEFR